jgi:hypothetical protein
VQNLSEFAHFPPNSSGKRELIDPNYLLLHYREGLLLQTSFLTEGQVRGWVGSGAP